MSLVYISCQDGRILGVKGNDIAFFSLLSSTSCRPMTFGEVGCFLSHYFIWLRIIAEDMRTVLILEDDIDFQPNFKSKLQRTLQEVNSHDPDWDLVLVSA